MENFSQYKACLFDVDKTLLNSQRVLTEKTRDVLAKLSHTSIKIGMCTGRSIVPLSHLCWDAFPVDALHVLCGGAQLVTGEKKVIWEQTLPEDVCRMLTAESDKNQSSLTAVHRSGLYGNAVAVQHWITHQAQRTPGTLPAPLADAPDFGFTMMSIHNINAQFIELLKTYPAVTYKEMRNYDGIPYVDITPSGITKAFGVQKWCEQTMVKPEEIIGFGDSENDLEFFDAIGYRVAMGNSVESLKQRADEVVEDCDRDGAAAWIERNLL